MASVENVKNANLQHSSCLFIPARFLSSADQASFLLIDGPSLMIQKIRYRQPKMHCFLSERNFLSNHDLARAILLCPVEKGFRG